jgi:hypothetical protein
VSRGFAIVAVVACALTGCADRAPTPTPGPPTVQPTPTLAPAPLATEAARAQARATPDPTGADPADIENAFLSNVDDVIAEAADLASSPCEDLKVITSNNANMIPTVRGFAATLKRVAGSQAVLDTDAVKAAMSDLDHSIGELDGALSLCGISQR